MPLLLQSALAWFVLLVASVIAVEMILPLLAPRLRRVATEGRLPLVVAFCWLPVGIASTVLAGCYAPWALAALGFGHDHCGVHGGHLHLCVQHVYGVDLAGLGWATLIAVGAWLTVGGRELVVDLWRGRALLRSLWALADREQDGVAVVDAEVPWSVTTGLWRPRIIVTSALLGALSARQWLAVLAHEDGHVRERHALVKLVAAIGSLVFRPSTRRMLLGQVALACERRCDERAAAVIGDRLDVAATLLATRRALGDRQRGPLPLGLLALHGSAAGFEARIRGLAEPVGSIPSSAAHLTALVGALAPALLILGHEIHHEVETLLSFFVH